MLPGLESASREDLLTVIGLLQRQNEELAAANERLAEANERLTARVAELERRLGRNSGNSSMPPSSDTSAVRRRSRRPRAGASGGVSPVPADPGCPWSPILTSPRITFRQPVAAAGMCWARTTASVLSAVRSVTSR